MKFETEFRKAHPETIGETDKWFDISNYSEWLEKVLTELQFDENNSCECGSRFFSHRHSNWMECIRCNKIKIFK